MSNFMEERIAYGRRIRQAAEGVLAEHGPNAAEHARSFANRAGLTDEDAAFLEAVAERVSRLSETERARQIA